MSDEQFTASRAVHRFAIVAYGSEPGLTLTVESRDAVTLPVVADLVLGQGIDRPGVYERQGDAWAFVRDLGEVRRYVRPGRSGASYEEQGRRILEHVPMYGWVKGGQLVTRAMASGMARATVFRTLRRLVALGTLEKKRENYREYCYSRRH